MDLQNGIDRWRGEFSEPHLEAEYVKDHLHTLSNQVFIFTGLAYLVFALADVFVLQSWSRFAIIVSLRLLWTLFSIHLYSRIPRMDKVPQLSVLLTVYMASGVLTALSFPLLYGPSFNFPIQAFGTFLIIFCLYHLFPVRLLYKTILASSYTLGFILISYFHHQTPLNPLMAYTIHSTLVGIFSYYTALRIQVLQRHDFILNRHLRKLATTDPLTGVANRLYFNQFLETLFGKAAEGRGIFSVILFDVDRFKNINDSIGHFQGDTVLTTIAQRVNQLLQPGDLFARLGGDEFAILLPASDEGRSLALASQLAGAISQTRFCQDTKVTCSFGVATYSPTDRSPLTILHRADRELYQDKGRNGIAHAR